MRKCQDSLLNNSKRLKSANFKSKLSDFAVQLQKKVSLRDIFTRSPDRVLVQFPWSVRAPGTKLTIFNSHNPDCIFSVRIESGNSTKPVGNSRTITADTNCRWININAIWIGFRGFTLFFDIFILLLFYIY